MAPNSCSRTTVSHMYLGGKPGGEGKKHGDLTYRYEDQRWVYLDPFLVARAHEADGAHGARDEQLRRQNGVDLAHELVADVDGGLGDAVAELEVIGNVVLGGARGALAGEEPGLIVGGLV